MKNFLSKFMLPFLAFLFIASAMATQVAPVLNISEPVAFVGISATIVAIQLVSPVTSFIHMGVETEIWVAYIKEKLFKVNKFLEFATNHDDKVLAGKVVHLPQAGASATIVKNRSVYPGVAARRTDTDINYSLDHYTSDPTHIPLNELAEVDYDKIDSVIGQDMGALVEFVADDMILKWLNAIPVVGSTIMTSGADSANTLPSGGTGTRKMLTESDIRRAVKLIRNQNYREQLYCQLSVNMMDELKESLSVNQHRDFSAAYDFERGIVGKLHGVIFVDERSHVATFDNAKAVRPLGATGAATDRDAGFMWGASAVARALGETKLFQDTDNPLYYGDIYSGLVRAGGRRTRSDNKGIVAILQEHGA